MEEERYREKLSIGRREVVLQRLHPPVEAVTVETGIELFKKLSVFDPELRPENYSKADGTPMRLFTGDSLRVDLSKRSVEDMGFWHRNIDFNEIIFCIQGALRWETELGEVTLHAGEMIWIPRGIAHRSKLCEESAEQNVLLELKVREDLSFDVERKSL